MCTNLHFFTCGDTGFSLESRGLSMCSVPKGFTRELRVFMQNRGVQGSRQLLRVVRFVDTDNLGQAYPTRWFWKLVLETAAILRKLREAPSTASVCCDKAGGSQALSGSCQQSPLCPHICLQLSLENNNGRCFTFAFQMSTSPSHRQTLPWTVWRREFVKHGYQP